MSGLQVRAIFENGVILEPTRGNRGAWNRLRRSPVIDLRNPPHENKDLADADIDAAVVIDDSRRLALTR